MRELKVVGLDVDGEHVLCEDDQPNRYRLLVDDQLRAAVRGDGVRVRHTPAEPEAKTGLRPRDIQARIRAGASVEQLAHAAGVDISRIARFANPVLLERARAAELASAAHPVLDDGPSVLTLLETVTAALVSRGLDPDDTQWDAWRNEDGRWTVQVAWKAGRSDNYAHFRYTPGAHGGTVTSVDDAAGELVNPRFERPLRVAPMAQPAIPEMVVVEEPVDVPEPAPQPEPEAPFVETVETELDTQPDLFADEPEPSAQRVARGVRNKRTHPAVPGWEDVLLGVRSAGDR
ncbi:MAG TPA: septation protein SepH [Mycobacterium sp.]|nr:septation protein SepH [Mycobacterium sp.]